MIVKATYSLFSLYFRMDVLTNIIEHDDLDKFIRYTRNSGIGTYYQALCKAVDSNAYKIARHIASKDVYDRVGVLEHMVTVTETGNLEMLKALHLPGRTLVKNRSYNNDNLLWVAVKHNHVEIVEWLLDQGYKCDNLLGALITSKSLNISMFKLLKDHVSFLLFLTRIIEDGASLSQYNEDETLCLRYIHDNMNYDCIFKICMLCNFQRKDKINELWQMETEDYNSPIQWLLQDTIEDIFDTL